MLRRLSLIFTVLVIAAMLSSCVNDNDLCEYATPGIVKLRFNLKLGDMGRVTRAGGIWNPSGDIDSGNSFDNAIKLNDDKAKWLHVMIINSAGDLLHLNLDEGFQLIPYEGEYEMTASLDFSDPEVRRKWTPGEYRVMVLANFRDRPNEDKDVHFSKCKDIASLEYALGNTKDYSIDWYNSDKSRNSKNISNIPMWGMTKAHFNFDGISTQMFSIQLLRSVAKVKIQLAPLLKEAGYHIVQAKVDNLNRKLNGFPAGWKDAESTVSVTPTAYDAAFNPKSSSSSDLIVNESSIPKDEKDGDGSLVFYLPEWKASSSKPKVKIETLVADDLGNEETVTLEVSNLSLGQGNYTNNINNVNRNHLYQFTLEKDIQEGELSYKLECWNLDSSAIGWNPDFTFSSKDSESVWGYVSFPSYNSSENKDKPEETASFADYEFTLAGPPGAVWKAFLVENGEEYSGEDKFYDNLHGSISDDTISYKNPANTPNGFFFGVGNDDDNNNKAASTGIARPQAYNIKIGTRLQTTDFDNGEPVTQKDNILALNKAGQYWEKKNAVPTCYLVIKIALDGKNFSEYLKINPAKSSGDFAPLTFPGDETRIEIRNLPIFYNSKKKHDNGRHVKGMDNDPKDKDYADYKAYTWWGYPMGHKDAATANPEPEPEPEPEPTLEPEPDSETTTDP